MHPLSAVVVAAAAMYSGPAAVINNDLLNKLPRKILPREVPSDSLKLVPSDQLTSVVTSESGQLMPISCVEAKLACSEDLLYSRQPSPTAASPAPGVAQQPIQPSANRPVCHFCGKVFRHNGHLNRHMYTHTGEKPHACPYCPHRNSRVDKLRHHMIAKHKEQLLSGSNKSVMTDGPTLPPPSLIPIASIANPGFLPEQKASEEQKPSTITTGGTNEPTVVAASFVPTDLTYGSLTITPAQPPH